jgi:hypothetical protein
VRAAGPGLRRSTGGPERWTPGSQVRGVVAEHRHHRLVQVRQHPEKLAATPDSYRLPRRLAGALFAVAGDVGR